MTGIQERLARCAEVYLHLYTDRYTSLGPGYDPNFACPLSEEQIEQFHSDVNYIEEHYGNSGIFSLTNRLKLITREFLDSRIVPDIMEHMDQHYFAKSFALFVKVVDEVYLNLTEIVLPDFPGRPDLSKGLYDACIERIYTGFEDLLFAVVFDELSWIRKQENITGHSLIYYLKLITKHFDIFDNSKWKDMYIDRVQLHTAEYANGLDIDAATFLSRALQRAHTEASLANSFRLEGAETSRLIKKQVFSGFVQVFNSVETVDDFLSLFEQTENQEKFQNLLKLYGNSNSWPTILPQIKERILETCAEKVVEIQIPNHIWIMEHLSLAVSIIGNYERTVYSRLRPRENQTIPFLRDMLLSTFKANFNVLFANHQDGQTPEGFLATFVEWLISRQEGDHVNFPPTLPFEDWRSETFENINVLAKHLDDKNQFSRNVESWLHLYSQEEAKRRNISFLNFLNMENVRNYVSSGIRERLRNEISTRRVSAREFAQRKGKVVDWVNTTGVTGSHEEALYNLILDSQCLYVVSVPFFAGCRKSVYIRMTGLQKEILNVVLQWKELSVRDLYDIMIRDDITEGHAQARDTVNIVLDSLTYEELVKKTPNTNIYNEEDIITINEEFVFDMPYVWISGPIHADSNFGTNVRYSLDLSIWAFMANANSFSISEVFDFVQHQNPMNPQLFEERLEVLVMRGFIAPVPGEPEMFSYVAP